MNEEGKISSYISVVAVGAVLIGAVFFLDSAGTLNESTLRDAGSNQGDTSGTALYDQVARLADVTDGNSFQEITTNGDAQGVVYTSFHNERYELVADLRGLPELTGDEYYEGWISNGSEEGSVVSTGRLSMQDGVYINYFQTDRDLRNHTQYQVTLEQNNGDPAPSGYVVLEGSLE